MKRKIKIIALCLCIAAFTALFAGCDILDDMKAKQAKLSSDKATITYNNNTYKKLPEGNSYYFNPGYSYKFDNSACITDGDVPVLLSEMNCYASKYDDRQDFFCIYFGEVHEDYFFYEYHYSSDEEGTYYSNEKDYDKYLKASEENELERIGFEYEVSVNYEDWYYVLDVASESLSKEILGYIENPEKMNHQLYTEITDNLGTECLQCSPYKCDSQGILAEVLEGYDVLKDINGKAYLVNYTVESAVELSSESANALKSEYYFGDYPIDIDKWNYDDGYYMGEADEEEELIVVDKKLTDVNI